DLYAQHVLSTGVVDPVWTAANGNANGTLLCGAANNQQYPATISDGAGGAIVTWQDVRNGIDFDIYAQHVRANGTVDPFWTANGTALCVQPNNQLYPQIVTDGAGGAIVTWQDARGAATDIYAQHVLASGGVDFYWPANGTAVCTATNTQ